MKKTMILFLSVVSIGIAGCALGQSDSPTAQEAEQTAYRSSIPVKAVVEPICGSMERKEVQTKAAGEKERQAQTATLADADCGTGNDLPAESRAEDPADEQEGCTEQPAEQEAPQGRCREPEGVKDTTPESQPEEQESVSAPPQPEETAVGYSADLIVSLVIEKCCAGGMETTEQGLNRLLAEGEITQEEYEEYYPLDGLEDSYYSVFINVDLNKAATTSGRLLGDEEGIADYIAGMLLLENDPLFNIRCTGTYETAHETFYEFRCYR